MEQEGNVLDVFTTDDGMTFRLIEVVNSFGKPFWLIRRNYRTFHVCDTKDMGQDKFYKIKEIFTQDNRIMKGGETHGRI